MSFHVRDLVKSYSGVPVLKGVDLSVEDGEVHALLGANGAGKSTLIKCISGATTPDAGEIEIGGRSYARLTPRESRRAGVSVVYQELSVASTLSVGDNVFLGRELRRGPFVRSRSQRAEAREWLARMCVDLELDTRLSSVGVAEAQSVEIVKALRTRPQVLILDEPTASLTNKEAQQLALQMRSLKEHGVPLLYVTHRLGEVFDLADRVSILRGGRVVLSGPVRSFDRDQLVTAIVGRSVSAASPNGKARTVADAPMLRVDSLVGPGIGPIDFELRAGEILGIFGLVGAGRTELLETLFGARRLHAGTVELEGERLDLRHPTDAIAKGIALVPSDRPKNGLFPPMRADDNVLAPVLGRLGRHGLRRRGRERASFNRVSEALKLEPPRPDLEARSFSGGNQQKLVLGRWLQPAGGCRVLLLDEPTQGVDVGARRELYNALRRFSGDGHAAIVASGEPEELLQVADRVLILSRGRAAGMLRRGQITERRLIELAHLAE